MIRFLKPKLKIIKKFNLIPDISNKININESKSIEEDSLNINTNVKTSISNDYKERLLAKQKLKFSFRLTETELSNYVKKIRKKKYFNKISLIELIMFRLDFIIFYLGFAKNISEAKQFISHGHILLNNKVNTISSILCKINDLISIKKNSKIINIINININLNTNKYDKNFNFNKENLTAEFISPILLEDSNLNYNESKIIEYYSNK